MIERLFLQNVRNIGQGSLADLASINLISGENGSGKTSILEALYLLAVGRSFRTSTVKNVVAFDKSSLVVSVKLRHPSLTVGIERFRNADKRIVIGHQSAKRMSDVAELLPVQIIHADSFDLVAGGPGARRRFLDWGVFHVEHQFLETWRHYERALKQRNELLRHGKMSGPTLSVWTVQVCHWAQKLDEYRQQYFKRFSQLLTQRTEQIGLPPVECEYYRGWNEETSLEVLLEHSLEKDLKQGFTGIGAHRCDIRIRTLRPDGGRAPAGDVLSRGQQKLLAALMIVCQGEFLTQVNGKHSVFLIDDLPAELDKTFQHYLMTTLESTGSQLFVTGIEMAELTRLFDHNASFASKVKMFHVEHGNIREF